MPFLKYAQYFPLGHPWISCLSVLQLRLSQGSQQLVAHRDLLIPENKDEKTIQGVFFTGPPPKRTRIPPQPPQTPVSNRKISSVPSYRFDNLVCIQNVLFLFCTTCSCVLRWWCWQPPGIVCLFGFSFWPVFEPPSHGFRLQQLRRQFWANIQIKSFSSSPEPRR